MGNVTSLTVNGKKLTVDVHSQTSLLSVLRNDLDLTGTKYGCGEAQCGAIVNPLHLENQIEGATVQAIGGALFESIEFANGSILNPRFKNYRLPRFSDVPPVEVAMMNRKDLPSAGAGETPIVGLAPAVSNAIFAATGKRLRSMPLTGLQN